MKTNLPKISIFTLGCKVNQYESSSMAKIFFDKGFDVVFDCFDADIFLVNTCAVTNEAERKSRQMIRKIAKNNSNAEIYVFGCASQHNSAQFGGENVTFVSGTSKKDEIAHNIADRILAENVQNQTFETGFDLAREYENSTGILTPKTRHFIKIQDGCNNFCSYCIIPYLRGVSRSRDLDSIISELDNMDADIKEVVLTGINLSKYGLDIGTNLTDLVTKLQKYDFRIRFGSLEVCIIDDQFLSACKGLKNFAPQFHLSLQSGSDTVLARMNRKYTTKDYADAAIKIRQNFDGASITTDIIVGFPEETDQEFLETVEFANEIKFSDIHVFSFSLRSGTRAEKMSQVPSHIIQERQKTLSQTKNELHKQYLLSQIGIPQQVIFETEENGLWVGHSAGFAKVYTDTATHNQVIMVTPTELYHDGLK